jgi:hypothetical protein
MFSADPDKASFVEIAITNGLLFLKWDFAAMTAGVSVIPLANFANVFPEHGAIIIISVIFLGPIGSASIIVFIILGIYIIYQIFVYIKRSRQYAYQ